LKSQLKLNIDEIFQGILEIRMWLLGQYVLKIPKAGEVRNILFKTRRIESREANPDGRLINTNATDNLTSPPP